jgi:chemosensory pili system protein ChpA (sensor histidine kinase/response regulator)
VDKKMSDNHNFLALDWVKSEIEETLKQAQQALEAYIANPHDVAKLRFCLAYLHQIFGTLQMVEFYGAAMLAEEMEKLVPCRWLIIKWLIVLKLIML